jgi:hypothetical protein
MSGSRNNNIKQLQNKMNKIGTQLQNALRKDGQNNKLILSNNKNQIFNFKQIHALPLDNSDEKTDSL